MRLVLATTALFATTQTSLAQLEIVGGKEAAVGQHLYVTGLRKTATASDQCGGSLIGPNVVLTAAHCLGNGLDYVSIGSHFLNGAKDGERIKVKQEIGHPKNDPRTNAYDFAILLLESHSKIPPVQLSFDAIAAGTVTYVRGWGTLSSGGMQANVLMEVQVEAIANDQCKTHLTDFTIDDTMLCAGGQAGLDSCQGDSGGPLTIEQNGSEVLVGVVSWGDGCADQGKPGVYGRLSEVREFVEPYLQTTPTFSPTMPSTTPSSPSSKTPTTPPMPSTSSWTTKKPKKTHKPHKPKTHNPLTTSSPQPDTDAPSDTPQTNAPTAHPSPLPSTKVPTVSPSPSSPERCYGCTGCYSKSLGFCLGADYTQAYCASVAYFQTIWCGR
ncbi:Aste57867_3079 [Aphanomyces stellatus]|uniref:Aste57867_3079 protein n=1 Tax=Aphanomyces stellatus TaxID=120398 RepID=A0A485K8Z1_9STRA|nr:hypothetical protein As57867_003070 [Aphanomyces stellatus]VFT80258.1 Aste57867_3079 [Aphanomyces stellatus]